MKPLHEMGKFATVVVDPPWPVSNLDLTGVDNGKGFAPTGFTPKSPIPYEVMSEDAIAALPLRGVCYQDSFLFLWTTKKFLPAAFGILSAWGLKYRFTMVWHKTDGPQIPNGPKFNAEFVVVGARGNPRFSRIDAFSVCNFWKRRTHSEKPEEFYDLLRRVTPEPRLDVFGRRRIPGFQSWGDQAPEGPALPGVYQDVLSL